jgi:hypothetical protein
MRSIAEPTAASQLHRSFHLGILSDSLIWVLGLQPRHFDVEEPGDRAWERDLDSLFAISRGPALSDGLILSGEDTCALSSSSQEAFIRSWQPYSFDELLIAIFRVFQMGSEGAYGKAFVRCLLLVPHSVSTLLRGGCGDRRNAGRS